LNEEVTKLIMKKSFKPSQIQEATHMQYVQTRI